MKTVFSYGCGRFRIEYARAADKWILDKTPLYFSIVGPRLHSAHDSGGFWKINSSSINIDFLYIFVYNTLFNTK